MPDLFRTAISTKDIKGDFPRLDIRLPVLSIGSCFAANMVSKLSEHGFVANDSLLGTVFNISSITDQLSGDEKLFNPDYFVERDGSLVSLMAHSNVFAQNTDSLETELKTRYQTLHQQLGKAQVLLLTLGSAWVYDEVETGATVANCQKQPAKRFTKRLQSVEELYAIGEGLLKLLGERYPQLKVVFSVSPVRHIKDGFAENMRSKAHLITAVHQLCEAINQSAAYFPAYEIIMDDLRDYRFYERDMLHPSTVAVDYIWQLFYELCVSDADKVIAKNFNSLYTFLQHRTLVSDQNRAEKIQQLAAKIPADLPALKLLNLT